MAKCSRIVLTITGIAVLYSVSWLPGLAAPLETSIAASPRLQNLQLLLAPQAPSVYVNINVYIENLSVAEAPSGAPPAEAVTETVCSDFALDVWQAGLYNYDEPFEKTGAETQEGDACIVWGPGPKKRQ